MSQIPAQKFRGYPVKLKVFPVFPGCRGSFPTVIGVGFAAPPDFVLRFRVQESNLPFQSHSDADWLRLKVWPSEPFRIGTLHFRLAMAGRRMRHCRGAAQSLPPKRGEVN